MTMIMQAEVDTLPVRAWAVPTPRVVVLDQICVSITAGDPIVLAGLRAYLREASGITLAAAGPGQRSDVAIVAGALDEQMYAEVRALRANGTRRVLVCVEAIEEAGLFAAVEAGACGVLQRAEITAERLASAVRAAAAGDGGLPPELLTRLLDHVQHGLKLARELRSSNLTAREAHVLRLVSEGFDTREIADQLCYSERTVKNVIHDITTRLQLRNRAHAVAYAVRQGLI